MTIVTYTTPNSSNVPVTISWYLILLTVKVVRKIGNDTNKIHIKNKTIILDYVYFIFCIIFLTK